MLRTWFNHDWLRRWCCCRWWIFFTRCHHDTREGRHIDIVPFPQNIDEAENIDEAGPIRLALKVSIGSDNLSAIDTGLLQKAAEEECHFASRHRVFSLVFGFGFGFPTQPFLFGFPTQLFLFGIHPRSRFFLV